MIIYDNGGRTFDRFTVLIRPTTGPFRKKGEWECLGLSLYPEHPQGFSQWGTALQGPHLGQEIFFEELPENVRLHIARRLELEEAE